MDSLTASSSPAPKPKQPLVARLGFFVVGGVASASINKLFLSVAQDHLHLPLPAAYATSAATTAVIFFIWSYFVNFRTSIVWKDCIWRYLTVFLIALLLTYLLGLTGLKHYGSKGLVSWLVIAASQSTTGGIKFLLYHFWVFPHGKTHATEPAAALS